MVQKRYRNFPSARERIDSRYDSYNSGSDAYGSYSGGSCCCSGGDSNNIQLPILLAALAAATFFLFQQITGGGRRAFQGRRRRKRVLDPDFYHNGEHIYDAAGATTIFDSDGSSHDVYGDLLWVGLEEFEEKIERLGQAEEKKQEEEGGSWINSILKELLRVKQETEEEMKEQEDEAVDDAADEEDLEKIEPPLLDMSWTEDQQKLQTIVDEQVAKKRIKRSVETKNKKLKEADIQESCKIKIWRCMSGVLESGVKYIEKPGGIMGAAKQVLFKIAFHGGLSNPWTSLMTIPEARRVARCMRDHDSCVTNQILADQVDNQVVGKRRVLVNPEFVQGLDSSDGQFQYNKEIADLMYDN